MLSDAVVLGDVTVIRYAVVTNNLCETETVKQHLYFHQLKRLKIAQNQNQILKINLLLSKSGKQEVLQKFLENLSAKKLHMN